jgi:hypothetical protein
LNRSAQAQRMRRTGSVVLVLLLALVLLAA